MSTNDVEYKNRSVTFCPHCKNCCESGKDPERGLVVICPGCNYIESSKEAVVYQSSSHTLNARSSRFPTELTADPTLPLVRRTCAHCQHLWSRKIPKDPANPYGELGVHYVCASCKQA